MIRLLLLAGVSIFVVTLPSTDHPDGGSLGGRVTDEGLVAIAGAKVSARNVFSGDGVSSESDVAGLYKFTGLRQGRYSVFGKAEAHGCTSVFNVFVFRGQHTQLDLMLSRSRKQFRTGDCIQVARSTK
jgi:hypothetical protein